MANLAEDTQYMRSMGPAVALTLLATAVYAVLYSHAKLLWNDEILTYLTVAQHSLGSVLHFQTTTPISFDPPAYEILGWTSTRLWGVSALTARLPSVGFFLLMQLVLFLLVSPVAGRRAGWLAMLLPVPLSVFDYGVEARPYALFLCAGLAAVLGWWRATSSTGRRRAAWLVCLFVALLAAATCQFYGFLVVLGPATGELVRSVRRRRVDWAVWGVVVAGCATALLDVPALHAIAQYHAHAVRPANLSVPEMMLRTFTWMTKSDTRFVKPLGAVVLVLIVAALVSSYRAVRRPERDAKQADLMPMWSALVALMFMEVPIVLVAYFVTFTYAPRHAIPSFGGVLALGAIGLGSFTRTLTPRAWAAAVALMLLCVVGRGAYGLKALAAKQRDAVARAQAPPEVKAFLLTHPERHAYIPIEACFFYSVHGDPALRKQILCLDSIDREVRYDHRLISSLSGFAIQRLPLFSLRMGSYEQMRTESPVYASLFSNPEITWMRRSVVDDHAEVVPVGEGFGGEVDRITFPAGTSAAGQGSR